MTSFGYRLNPRYAIKECLSCGALYTGDFCCSKGNVEDKILVPKPPKNYARCTKCGHPVNGPYCQGCTLLRKKREEDLVTYFQNFQNTSESSDDSTNIVNAPREPFKQEEKQIKEEQAAKARYWKIPACCDDDDDYNSAITPEVSHACFRNYDRKGERFLIASRFPTPPLTCAFFSPGATVTGPHENFQCQPLNYCEPNLSYDSYYSGFDQFGDFHPQQYTCCDNCEGLHETFQCQPMNQNFYNSNSFGFDQSQTPQFLVIHPPPQETSIEILHDQENVINSVQTFLRKFNRYSFFEMPKVLLLAWDRVFEIKDALGTKQYKPEDIQELFRQLLNDVQNIHEELAEYINTPGWNPHAFYDDDDDDDVDYTIAIAPVLSTEEPVDFLSMGDEHLDTIPATESDEVIKSSVEDLIPIPSKSEGIPEHKCDVPFHDNSPPLDVSKDQIEDLSDSNKDFSSIDDDSFSIDNIDYVEASPPDSELVSSKVMEIVIPVVGGIDDDILLTIKDLLTKSSSTSPKYFLEETNTFHNSLPEFENFCFDLEEISSASTTTHSDISLPDYEAFYFDDDHIKEISSGIEDDYSPLLTYVVWIFLAYLTYPVIPPYLHSFENEDTIFDPEFENFYFDLEEISSGSTTTHSDISLPDYKAFYFNDDHIKEISSDSTTTHSDISFSEYDSFIIEELVDELAHIISPPDIPINLKTLAKGFYPPSLNFLSFNWES
nr:hypothetical protein [Tanacetum cinerariifolium]